MSAPLRVLRSTWFTYAWLVVGTLAVVNDAGVFALVVVLLAWGAGHDRGEQRAHQHPRPFTGTTGDES